MSVTELVILSSSPASRCNYNFSPPRSAQSQVQNTESASPDLPTLSKLLATKDVDNSINDTYTTVLKNGSGVELEVARPQVELAGKKAKRVKKTKVADKSNAEQALAIGSENPVKKAPRQRKKKVSEQSGENDEVSRYFNPDEQDIGLRNNATKKPRKKRQTAPKIKILKNVDKEGDLQDNLAKNRITMPLSDAKAPAKDSYPIKDTKEESQISFLKKDELSENGKANNRENDEKNPSNCDNEPSLALPRRANWTPPKCSDSLPPSNQAEFYQGQVTSETLTGEPSIFQLLPDYRFDSAVSRRMDILNSAQASEEVPAKKRRLETTQLPESGQMSDAVPKQKQQRAKKVAQKKKARTITELAMAQYRLPDGDETSIAEAEPRTLEPPTLENITLEVKPKKPSRRKKRDTQSSDCKTKVPETKIKKKKAVKKPKKSETEPVTKLLSPKAALASLQRQDLLFGTSSQLAREESPPYIRDLQQAFAESEKVVLNTDTVAPSACIVGNSKLSIAKRNLWEAAARDHEDELLLESEDKNPSNVDQEISKDISDHADFSSRKSPDLAGTRPLETSDSRRLYDVDSTRDEIRPTEQGDPPAIKVVDALPTPENSNTSARPETPPPPPLPKSTDNHPDEKGPRKNLAVSSPYEVLSPERSAIKKPITSPFSSHSLLLSQNSSHSKESTGWTHIDEISDSEPEPEFTPSPPRRHNKQTLFSKSASASPSSVPPLKLSCRESPTRKSSLSSSPTIKAKTKTKTKTTLTLEENRTSSKPSKPTITTKSSTSSGITPESATWSVLAPSLFAQITTVVKASPPSSSSLKTFTSKDPQQQRQQQQEIKEVQPSWYERMLMYEPIDIETLTVWLNEQGLRVPVTVKATMRKKRQQNRGGRGGGGRGKGGNVVANVADAAADATTDDKDGAGFKDGTVGRKEKGKKKKKHIEEQIEKDEEIEEETEAKNKKVEDGELRQEFRELSSWMVRKWCQEFSVCCVWRDGVNGWRRK